LPPVANIQTETLPEMRSSHAVGHMAGSAAGRLHPAHDRTLPIISRGVGTQAALEPRIPSPRPGLLRGLIFASASLIATQSEVCVQRSISSPHGVPCP
jgi:hypothetical protein